MVLPRVSVLQFKIQNRKELNIFQILFTVKFNFKFKISELHTKLYYFYRFINIT